MKKNIFYILFFLSLLWSCKPKNQDTVKPDEELKTVVAENTVILPESELGSIISIKGNELIFRTPKNGRLSEASFGAGTNLIIAPNGKYPDGVALNLVSVNKNGNGTSTAQTKICQLDEVCESLDEKATAVIGPSTISRIYKPNGDELPYSVNGNVGVVPIDFTFPLHDKADKELGKVNIKGSIEFSGSMDFVVVMNKNTRYWLSKTTIQDKEKLTATFTVGAEQRKIKIDKDKNILLGAKKFEAKPFTATIPLFETKLAPVPIGPAFWITPRIKFYVKIEGNAEGQISLTILDRDGGKAIFWDEYTDAQGWKSEKDKIIAGETTTLSNLELGLVGSLALTPTLEISGSPWGYKDVAEVGATLGLESKIEAGLKANLPQADLLVQLTGQGAVKVGGRVKLSAIWKSLIDWEPGLTVGASWDIFPPLEYSFDIETSDLTTGLVAYYPFNGNANDESGNANNGKIGGKSASFTKGVKGQCISLNGIRSSGGTQNPDRVFVAASKSLNFTNQATYSFWASIEGKQIQTNQDCSGSIIPGIWGAVIAKDGDRNGFNMNIGNNDASFSFLPWDGGAGIAASGLPSFYQAFHHVVFTINGKVISLFVDGLLVKTETKTQDFNFTYPNQRNLYIGSAYNGQPYTLGGACLDYWGQFDGKIDEVRLYNRTLSNTEVGDLYNLEKP